MKLQEKILRKYISFLLEAPLGVEQQIGYGKNYHTVNPQPITWEDYPGLDYNIAVDPDGSVWASVEVLDYPEMSTPERKWADEATAMAWIRNEYDALYRRLMNLKSE